MIVCVLFEEWRLIPIFLSPRDGSLFAPRFSSMLLTITSAGWRRPGAGEPFEITRAVRPQSHLEFNCWEGAGGTTLTEVWVDLYLTADAPLQKLMMYRMDAQDLEWRFTFDGSYEPLVVGLSWTGFDEDTGEVTLRNEGVPRDLLDEIEAGTAV